MNKYSKLALIGTLILPALAALSSRNNLDAKARTVQTDKLVYNKMLDTCAGMSGTEVNPNKDGELSISSYSFLHGSVASSELNRFEDYTASLLGVEETTTSFFQNWRMNVVPGDNLIIKFKTSTKARFVCDRAKLGNDYRNNLTLNVYKNDSVIYTVDLSDANQSTDPFKFETVFEATDTIFYELENKGVGNRAIQMDAGGADWSTLPTFLIQEVVNVDSNEVSFEQAVTDYSQNQGSVAIGSFASYDLLTGSIDGNSLASFTTFNSQDKTLTSDIATLTTNSIALTNGSFTYKVTANKETVINVSYPQSVTTTGNLLTKGYLYNKTNERTKKVYTSNNADKDVISGNFLLKQDDILYLEFLGNGVTTNSVPNLIVSELINDYNDSSSFPKYVPSDFSNKTTITHKEIAFETGRTKCEPIDLKDITVQLLSGLVKENKAELAPFNNIKYDDGVYLEGNIDPVLLLSEAGVFDGNGFAGVEDYRLKTSSAKNVVYKFVAKRNTVLKITHPATTGGWADEAGKTYFGEYYENKGKEILVNKKYVSNGYNAADTFADTVHLKQEDVFYLVYGSEAGTDRNINITFNFETDPASYSDSAREEKVGPVMTEAPFYEIVRKYKANDCQPIDYDGNLEISFGYGNYKQPEAVTGGVYDSNGDMTDTLVGGTGATNCCFFLWQIRAGDSGQDAIMKFTALKNIEFSIVHPDIDNANLWATSSSVKYYIKNSDDVYGFITQKYVASDCGENYFGININLRAGETLIFDYTSNDDSNFGVVYFEATILANTNSFDESKAYDFTEAVALNNARNNYLAAISNKIAQLVKENYSLANYGQILEYVDDFERLSEQILSQGELTEFYNTTIHLIDQVETKAEELARITVAINNAITEASSYLNSKMNQLTAESQSTGSTLLLQFIEDVRDLESENSISKALKNFKNQIDALEKVAKKGCGGSVIAASSLISLTTLIGVGLLLRKKNG